MHCRPLRQSLVVERAVRQCLRDIPLTSTQAVQRRFYQSQQASSPAAIIRSSLCKSGRTIDFARGWAWQQLLLSRRLARRQQQKSAPITDYFDNDVTDEYDADVVLLLEHAPVYTLGRGADENYLLCLKDEANTQQVAVLERLARTSRGPDSARLSVDRRLLNECDLWQNDCREIVQYLANLAQPVVAPNGVPIYRVERGGEVTFHGPGQLVVYPLLDLQREPFQEDLRWYLRMIEEVVIEVLMEYDVDGVRDEINNGVWVDQDKIAAVGVSASRWITTHGFALNVSTDLNYFDSSVITPCGIDGRGVTSLAKLLQERGELMPSTAEVTAVVIDKLRHVFGIELKLGEPLS